ncbi:MAG TPA: M1 family metallopeptidase [Actinoplanes sp.]
MTSLRAGMVGVALVIAGCTGSEPAPAQGPSPTVDFRPGAEGAGDPYFPKYGNGGYDVTGYDLKLRYDPKTDQLGGTATITATATQNLSRFDLDLSSLTVHGVRVDGTPATSKLVGTELMITPAAGIVDGRPFTVVVDYGGKPDRVGDRELGQGGWLTTDDGAIALGQPASASSWFPVNDHPSDKATFALAMTVPDGVEAISNGVPGPTESAGGWTTWHWTESAPMASYLAAIVIGQYRVTTTKHAGKPMVIAVAGSLPADGGAVKSLGRTGEIADFLATRFGPYPFASYGGIAIADQRIGYALETQSRPAYANAFFTAGPNDGVVVHELAHQWFGDSVAVQRWRDIWLNEGFATYAEWLWDEHTGKNTVAKSFAQVYASYPWGRQGGQVGDPGVDRLFGTAVYQRGGMTVYALRKTIGDAAFDRLVKQWTTDHRNGNVTTEELIGLAEQISGQDLDSFFQAWLYTDTKPPLP